MQEKMTHEEYVDMQRRRVVELARQILSNQIDILDGCCKIAALRWQLEVPDGDDDLMAFMLVDTETDNLPVGDEAQNWADEALALKEPELREARDWALNIVRQPCKNLLIRFDKL